MAGTYRLGAGKVSQIHVNLSEDDQKRLASLTRSMQKSVSEVVRALIREATAKKKAAA